jgi:phage-related minor tail protein
MRLMGFTIDESIALFAKWEKEGVNAELVMGSLRIAAGKFAKEGQPLKKSLMDTFDAIKKNKDATAALALGMEVFGARAGPDMVAAIREGRFSIDDLVAGLGKADGAIMGTAAATMDFPEKLKMVTNKLSVALAPIGLAIMDVIGTLVDDLGPTLVAVGDWLGKNLPAALQFVKDKFTEYWPIIYSAVMSAWAIIQPILQGLAAFFVDRIMPVVSQVVAWFQTNWPMISATIQQVFDVIKGIIDQVVVVFGSVGTSMQSNAGFVQEAWQKIQTLIAGYLAGIWGIIQQVLGIIQAFMRSHGAAIQAALASAWMQIQAIILLALDVMNATIIPFFKGVAQFLQDHSTEIQNILSGAWDVISNLIQGALDLIQGILTVAMDLLSGNWEKAWEDVKTTLGNVWGHIEGILKTGLEAAGNLLNPFIDTALKPFRDAFDGIGRAISGVIQWIKDLGTSLSTLSLPDWLTPGSPTPFELGLVGIADAMRQVEQMKPALAFNYEGSTIQANQASGPLPAAGDTIYITINAPGGDPTAIRGAVMDGLATARAKGLR